MEEKKKLNLKIKTFADLKRFKSRKVHEIVGKMRESNGKVSKEELKTFSGLVKYAARRSLIRKSNNNRAKQTEKLNAKYNEEKSILKELLENKQITKEQYDKQMEKLIYKTRKKIFEKDLGEKDQEKPKNPTIQRAIKSVGKVAKTVGKGIITGASMVAGVVAVPFVAAYKGVRALGRGIKTLGRGGKNFALTAGKVTYKGAKAVANKVEPGINAVKDTARAAGQTIKETSKEVKETENARKDSKNAKTLDEKREIFENSSKEAQEAIISDDYKAALRENAKRERESARRESLHMDAERQPIDHEEAKKKTFERVDGQELTSEEVKEVYGDEEK